MCSQTLEILFTLLSLLGAAVIGSVIILIAIAYLETTAHETPMTRFLDRFM